MSRKYFFELVKNENFEYVINKNCPICITKIGKKWKFLLRNQRPNPPPPPPVINRKHLETPSPLPPLGWLRNMWTTPNDQLIALHHLFETGAVFEVPINTIGNANYPKKSEIVILQYFYRKDVLYIFYFYRY